MDAAHRASRGIAGGSDLRRGRLGRRTRGGPAGIRFENHRHVLLRFRRALPFDRRSLSRRRYRVCSVKQPTQGPLAGIRVLEFGQIAAGPFCGMLLADLGADVVKVERPDGGDDMRQWPPLTEGSDGDIYSANFASLNRNKRSISVDLKDADQLTALRRLCTAADVVLENFRPGVLSRLGLGYEALSKLSPGLVFCSVSGY